MSACVFCTRAMSWRVGMRRRVSTDIDNGGSAFPTSFNRDYPNEIVGGMTLRDYFAAKVVVGDEIGVRYAEQLLGRAMPDYAAHPLANAIFWADARARLRYIEADAMLAAREAA
ncbi:hypothetical protein AEMCBJ_11710 [Cupriavidus necator]